MEYRRIRSGRGNSGRVIAFAIALAATWIAAPAGSQIRPEPGEPFDLDAEARAIGQLVTAAEVADWARDRRDAEAMLVASRMMGEVRNRSQSGDAPFLTSAVLLQEAETLAADDPDILERVRRQQSPNKGVRSSPFGPGPIVLVRRLRARETYSFTVEARRNEVLRVAAIGDGDTNIDLTIRDAEGVVLCNDGSRDHYPVCTLNHPRPGTLRVEVVNRGGVWSRVQILTN